MKNQALVLLFVLFAVTSLHSQKKNIVIGEERELHSNILNETRRLLVYLPVGYESSQSKYPVLYLTDGSTHFLHASGVVDFLSDAEWMPEMIVVGVYVNRNRDLTPRSSVPHDYELFKGGGEADNFLTFLSDELIPFIDTVYRTEPCKILFGHSLGGLFTIYTLIHHPDLFKAYIAASPSLWWDNGSVVRDTRAFLGSQTELSKTLFFSCGNEEILNPGFSKEIINLADILSSEVEDEFRWKYAPYPDDDHSIIAHQTIYDGLRFVFANWSFPPNVRYLDLTLRDFKEHYATLSHELGYECKPAESFINRMAYRRLNIGRTKEAIELFQYNVELYPESANVYDSQGEGFMKDGQIDLAVRSYEKSLELNPNNENAREMLKRMKTQEQ